MSRAGTGRLAHGRTLTPFVKMKMSKIVETPTFGVVHQW